MQGRHHYFYVLVVVPPYTFRNSDHRVNLAAELRRIASKEQSIDSSTNLVYRIVEVDSVRRALLAAIVNPDILAVVIQDNVPIEHSQASSHALVGFEGFVRGIEMFVDSPVAKMRAGAPVLPALIRSISQCRANVDIFCVCTAMGLGTLEPVSHLIKRAFFPNDDHSDLHEAILAGVRSKMRCPFFEALKRYAERPIGVFHALAISRGNSVRRSKWIQGLIDFYGVNLFKAESSATCGGLDSLLDPHGSLLDAQNLAARAYDASYAFFVTNGTSTSNKIVLQVRLTTDTQLYLALPTVHAAVSRSVALSVSLSLSLSLAVSRLHVHAYYRECLWCMCMHVDTFTVEAFVLYLHLSALLATKDDA